MGVGTGCESRFGKMGRTIFSHVPASTRNCLARWVFLFVFSQNSDSQSACGRACCSGPQRLRQCLATSSFLRCGSPGRSSLKSCGSERTLSLTAKEHDPLCAMWIGQGCALWSPNSQPRAPQGLSRRSSPGMPQLGLFLVFFWSFPGLADFAWPLYLCSRRTLCPKHVVLFGPM